MKITDPAAEVRQHRLEQGVPMPALYPWNRRFFEAGTDGKLMLQRCSACHRLIYYPRMLCPNCLSPDYVWEQLSGRATVYSFAIVWRANHPAFADQLPITLAVVDLLEGAQMVTTLVDCPGGSVEIGMEVRAVFDTIAPGVALPKFAPLA